MRFFCPTISVVNDLKFRRSETYSPLKYYPTLKRNNKGFLKHTYKKIISFDSEHIPYVHFKGENRYLPITIAQHGLCLYNFYINTRDKSFLFQAIKIAEWMVKNQNPKSGIWENNFDFYSDHVSTMISGPFPSAMGQSECISLLCRIYYETKDTRFLNAAEYALLPFFKKTSEGGVVAFFDNMPFYEEFPTKPPSYILNGFIFSLIGLYELYFTSENNHSNILFTNGYDTLIKILPLYDYGFTSLYCLNHYSASPRRPSINEYYHPIHLKLLQAMNNIKRSSVLEFYINKWR